MTTSNGRYGNAVKAPGGLVAGGGKPRGVGRSAGYPRGGSVDSLSSATGLRGGAPAALSGTAGVGVFSSRVVAGGPASQVHGTANINSTPDPKAAGQKSVRTAAKGG